ncbi:head GIN domain-containing protein [Maribacter sp. 2308TA10-17]|uniref:head GIN domain-containing protein n=1 Tax=Maribacter sp. 2308TA10-17 TaxID=3386276 RepID=UPI0039BC4377
MSACNSDSAPDCFQSAGDLIREEVKVADFTKITVFENVGLVLKQGPEIKVEVETGENLLNEVEVTVEDGRLLLRDTNDCNFVREYGLTRIFVTAPNIGEIRSSTGLKIESDGVLAYPILRLISESFNNPESETTDGEFDLELDTNDVTVIVNGIAYFRLQGETGFFGATIAAGDSRIEAQDLIANLVDIDHRGSNDILVNPQQIIKGEIRGTGDVISFNEPDLIQVEQLFKGRLIFKD